MVTFAETSAFTFAQYRLVSLADQRILLQRPLRACDAEVYNRDWAARGVPTRWEPAEALAAAG
jgi:hypothetical protein